MRVAFAGTPRFAAVALQAILDAGHQVALVLSQPDRPAGRGLKVRASEVSDLARARGLHVLTPGTLRADDAPQAIAALRGAAPDLLVVAAYGLILPQSVLDVPAGVPAPGGPVRAVNIHASLLPRWRGAAPVARAIEAGDTVTGITLMQMEAGLDTGPMLLSEAIDIDPSDTAATLTARLAQLGGRLIASLLATPAGAGWASVPQPAEGVSYARKIERSEAWLDWSDAATTLARRVRAFDPEPGACGLLNGAIVKIWAARAEAGAAPAVLPGTVVAAGVDGVRVACGTGVLAIRELQRAGGRRLRAREFVAGTPVPVGARWQSPPPGGPG